VAQRRDAPALVVSPTFLKDTAAVARRADVRFVMGEATKELPQAERLIEELRPELAPAAHARIHLEVVPGTDIHRFQTFADQDVVVSRTIEAGVRALGRTSSEAAR
jgi:hypothetical protein